MPDEKKPTDLVKETPPEHSEARGTAPAESDHVVAPEAKLSKAAKPSSEFSNARYQFKLAMIGAVLLVAIGIVYQNRELYIHNPQIRPYLPEILLATPEPSPVPSPSPEISPSPEVQIASPSALFHVNPIPGMDKQFILQRKDDSGEFKDVLAIDPNVVTKWNDTFIYNEANRPNDLRAFGLNLKTLQASQVASVSAIPEIGNAMGFALSDLTVIGDDLYISVGGYMTEGATYWMNLKAPSIPMKIATTHNAGIVFQDGRYFINGGEGDGCGGSNFFSLLDPSTQTVRQIVTTAEGCVAGVGYIGQNAQYFYLADHEKNVPVSKIDTFTVYDDLVQMNIDSGEKTTLISKADMPADTIEILYFPKQQKMLLVGRALTVYDLNNKSLTKLIGWDQNSISVNSLKKTDLDVCIHLSDVGDNNETKNQFNYRVDLVTNTAFTDESCRVSPENPDQYSLNTIKKAQELLNLPQEYRIVYSAPQP